MQEMKINEFDYKSLDVKTSQFLKVQANSINQIVSKSSYEIGRVLYESQRRLAKDGYGCFEEWYSSLGFKKTESYQYINHYKFVRSESEQTKIEMFEALPKSIRVEMSKPSAIDEVNQAVFNGDITQLKEYKELEHKYKAQSQALKEKDDIINRQHKQILENKPKVEVREVIPEDYEQLKRTNQQLKEEYQKLFDERSKTDEKSRKYEELTRFIKEAEGKLSETQKRISDYRHIHKLLKESNEFLSKASALAYTDISHAVIEDPFVKQEFQSLLNNLERFQKNIQSFTELNIIEGEIINE